MCVCVCVCVNSIIFVLGCYFYWLFFVVCECDFWGCGFVVSSGFLCGVFCGGFIMGRGVIHYTC